MEHVLRGVPHQLLRHVAREEEKSTYCTFTKLSGVFFSSKLFRFWKIMEALRNDMPLGDCSNRNFLDRRLWRAGSCTKRALHNAGTAVDVLVSA